MPRSWLPVIHAAVPDRPDEEDTVETAAAIAAALGRAGFDAEVIDIGADFAPLRTLARRRPALVFNMVEAVGGDGALLHLPVRLMERLGLRFTGSGSAACELTTSKRAMKRLLADRGLPTPRWWETADPVPAAATVIVKPDGEHGSLGIDSGSVVPGARAAAEIADRERRHGGRFFAEAYVEGREFNVGLLEGRGGVEVLPIPEILFDGLAPGRPRIVDYEAKWDAASHAYHHTPRRFGLERAEPALAAELGQLARACWDAAGLAGYARVDFRVGAGGPQVLEINANPCLAPDAGFAATAAVAGLSWDAVILRIVEAARVASPAVA